MNVLVIHGSPRKHGNSSFLAGKLAESLDPADLNQFWLADLQYKGCRGCMACRKQSEICVMRDGLTDVLAAVKEADVTILAAPVYQEHLNGDVKCCVDRFFSFLSSDHFRLREAGEEHIPSRIGPDKTAIMLLAQGQPETSHTYLDVTLHSIMDESGYRHVHIVRCGLLNSAKDSRERPDLWDRLDKLGHEVRVRYSKCP